MMNGKNIKKPNLTDYHIPVLLQEAIEYLNIQPGEKYVDATVGGGGHSLEILKHDGQLLAIDCDPEAIEAARKLFLSACPKTFYRLALGNFALLKKICQENNFNQIAGILFDLGVSSHQLTTSSRGFSFNQPGPLDMRMDPDLKVTAADLVNNLEETKLADLFFQLGDEHYSRSIAKAIVGVRQQEPIKTSNQLTEIILKARPKSGRYGRIHPATRVFQALRMAVNDELNNLKQALLQAVELLKPEGRLVVISFHSGEDRIVKNFFKEQAKLNRLIILTKKVIKPTWEEIKINPRCHSGRLRVASKNEI